MGRSTEVTSLLEAWSHGDAAALDRLIPMVYDDLRKVAGRRLRMEREGHTLSATALVHETYLRLMGQQPSHLENRSHFFAVASELMRRILVDHARRRAASKRGGGAVRLTLDPAMIGGAAPDLDLVALDDALTALATLDPRQARIVELRFFGGLSAEEAAMVLGDLPRHRRARLGPRPRLALPPPPERPGRVLRDPGTVPAGPGRRRRGARPSGGRALRVPGRRLCRRRDLAGRGRLAPGGVRGRARPVFPGDARGGAGRHRAADRRRGGSPATAHFPPARGSAPTSSATPWARAGWASCTAPSAPTTSTGRWWRSR